MKLILRVVILLYILGVYNMTIAQESSQTQGGQMIFNSSGLNCLSEVEYQIYQDALLENVEKLRRDGIRVYRPDLNRDFQQVAFTWPVKQANDFNYNSTWAISGYFDHDEGVGSLEDWNCGTRTYDTSGGYNHQGVDIFLWPFSWKQVEEEQSEVIAAAGGQIVFKSDGSFDKNCSFNNQQWNAVFIEHSDGSIAWYGHMKNGSLTTKNVGDTVEQGEFLGVIASSGNSTGPHLHFEVYESAGGTLVDPYSGPCNDINVTSWWQDQKEYLNSGVNAALTHTDLPNFGTCPEIEETFESDQFDPESSVWFIGYYKDQVTGSSALNEVYDPNGDLFASWDTNFTDDFVASWWAEEIAINSELGEWTYKVTYNGESAEHTFTVGQLSVEDEIFDEVRLFPNPTNDIITIGAPVALGQVTLHDALGRIVLDYSNVNEISLEMDLTYLESGIYFVTAKAIDSDAQTVLRVIKR